LGFGGPYEADAPLIIDSDAVLTLSIILQRLQVVAGRRFQEGNVIVRAGELYAPGATRGQTAGQPKGKPKT